MSDIDEIITYRSEEHPNLLWLEVKTKDGVTGLGETFFAAEALEAYIHSNLAPIVLGLPSEDIGMVHLKSRPYVGFVGAGLELRARSALDIALWDILGKSSTFLFLLYLEEGLEIKFQYTTPVLEIVMFEAQK